MPLEYAPGPNFLAPGLPDREKLREQSPSLPLPDPVAEAGLEPGLFALVDVDEVAPLRRPIQGVAGDIIGVVNPPLGKKVHFGTPVVSPLVAWE